MIQLGLSLLAVAPQAAERIDFTLHSGVILTAIAIFVLVNVLLAAVLYPYFRSSDSNEEGTQQESVASSRGSTDDVVAHEEGEIEQRVDEFLEDIHRERTGS